MTPRHAEHRKGRTVGTGRRETDLRRRPATREQRRTVLITTNGESTERTYFDALKREPWISAKVAVAVERGSPVDLVRDAYRRQRDNDYDEAWAVCDVDHYPPGEASAEAQRSGVRLAWSNPCFEVWLL
ncbi:RloB family protein, partial [Micromonospora lutea]|uniref:RloB family protein n=1 Tax=Micromonospora lutea TaxID=419825 RepID=UPI00195213B5